MPASSCFRRLPVAVIVALAASPAFAQAPVDSDRSREPVERLEQQRQVERARDSAIDLDSFGIGPPVSYEQVLAEPDNIDLNVRYALGQIRAGDVRGGAATLERVLLLDPDLPAIRVLYAILLFRLESLDEAERELLAVRELPMDESLRRQIADWLAQIDQKRRRTRFVATIALSGQYDWNRTAAPKSEIRLAADVPTQLSGSSVRRHDYGGTLLTSLSVDHDMGMQRRHLLVGSATYYQSEQFHLNTFDLSAYAMDGGVAFDMAGGTTVTPKMAWRHVWLEDHTYQQAIGPLLSVEHEVVPTLRLKADITAERQIYHNIPSSQTLAERTGRMYRAEPAVTWIVTPEHRIEPGLGFERTVAADGYNSYTRAGLTLGHTWILGDGGFLLSVLSLTQDEYDSPDPSISETTRRDAQWRARFTYGLPLGVLFRNDQAAEGPTLLVGFEAFRQVSTVTNYTYDNYRLTLGLTRRWEF